MGQIEQSILLSAVGGDGAAAQVDMVNKSLKQTEATHDELKNKFGERFQHLGLQMFAGEALMASGVGRETREVVNILNLAMNAMGGAMSGAVGPIIMVVSALAAVAGIITKVIDHQKDLSAQLEKTNAETNKQLSATNSAISSIQNYTKEIGYVPDYLKRWEDSEKSLQKAQVDRQLAGDRAQIASLTMLMNQEARHQEQMRGEIGDLEKLIASLKAMGTDIAVVAAESARLDMMNKQFREGSITVAAHKAQIDQLIAEVKLLADNGTSDLAKLAEAHKKAAEEAKRAAEEAKKISDKEAEEETARYQHWAELHAKTLITNQELTEKYNKNLKETSLKAVDDISQGFGDAFVGMMFHGKDFVDSMTQSFEHMTEQIIADIIKIKIEWMIMSAMMPGMGLGMGGGAGGFFGMAEGGSMLVDKPTMFMAGEAGQPEIATFTPLSKLGSGASSADDIGSGGGLQIGSINVNVYEAQDANKIAAEVGRKIIERVRGMGELNFTRSA